MMSTLIIYFPPLSPVFLNNFVSISVLTMALNTAGHQCYILDTNRLGNFYIISGGQPHTLVKMLAPNNERFALDKISVMECISPHVM